MCLTTNHIFHNFSFTAYFCNFAVFNFLKVFNESLIYSTYLLIFEKHHRELEMINHWKFKILSISALEICHFKWLINFIIHMLYFLSCKYATNISFYFYLTICIVTYLAVYKLQEEHERKHFFVILHWKLKTKRQKVPFKKVPNKYIIYLQ